MSSSGSLFGCRVHSDLALPELAWPQVYAELSSEAVPSLTAAPIQVSVQDSSDQSVGQPQFRIEADGKAVLQVSDVTRLMIAHGKNIEIKKLAGSDDAMVRLYLLGSAMGCILYQRGLIPLHISTVSIDGQAWGFTAPSGTGKSTLAARLYRFAGCPMVSDDVAALYFIEGQPHVAGGPPLMKLQPEFAALFPDAHIEPIPHPESNKLKVQVKNSFIPGLVPLAGIIVLERDDTVAQGDLEIEPLTGTEAFLGAREAIYRYQMGLAMSSQAHMFNKLTELTTHVPFYRGRLGDWSIADGGSTEAAIVERIAHLRK